MANHKSAKKRTIRNEKKRVENKMRTSKMRTFIKKVESLIAGGKNKEAKEAFKDAEAQIAKSKKTNLLHKKTAARMTSRLSKKIKSEK